MNWIQLEGTTIYHPVGTCAMSNSVSEGLYAIHFGLQRLALLIRYLFVLTYCRCHKPRSYSQGNQVLFTSFFIYLIKGLFHYFVVCVYNPHGCDCGGKNIVDVDDIHNCSALRVADASIMPRIVSCNTNATVRCHQTK